MSEERGRTERELFEEFLAEASNLSKKLIKEATADKADPALLMRLTALGVNHCLVGISALLEEKLNK